MIRIKKLTPLISFFLLLFIILSFSVNLGGRSVVFDFLRLPLKVFTYPGTILEEIIFSKIIKNENEQLKEENTLLNYKISRLLNMKDENIRLKELLEMKRISKFRFVVAGVVARDPDNWNSTLIIDKGQEAGVVRDCVVIGQRGLVGIVSDAGITTSRVILINDLSFNCAVSIERTRVQGLLSGSIFAGCRLSFISREDDIVIGDVVLTSGLTLENSRSLFPKAIVIGKVKYIGEESSGLGKYCLVEPIEQLHKLEEVLVIIP